MSRGLTRESYKGPFLSRKTTFVFLFWIILIQTSQERLVGILDSGVEVVPLEQCHFLLVLRGSENNITNNVTTNITALFLFATFTTGDYTSGDLFRYCASVGRN